MVTLVKNKPMWTSFLGRYMGTRSAERLPKLHTKIKPRSWRCR